MIWFSGRWLFLFPDEDECAPGHLCSGGECINEPGSFRCRCPPGFQLSDDSSLCQDVRQEACYDSWQAGACSRRRPLLITAAQCCCSSAAAWGADCQPCPDQTSPQFIELCPGERETHHSLTLAALTIALLQNQNSARLCLHVFIFPL